MSTDASQPVPGPASAVERALAALAPLEGTLYRERLLERIDECGRIHRFKVAPSSEPAAGARPALAVIGGGTKVGKSTVTNAIAGEAISASSPIARATKAAVVYVHRDGADAFRRQGFLPGYERQDARGPEDAIEAAGRILVRPHEDATLAGLAIADLPDIDSVLAGNRRIAHDLLYASDAVIFVASQEKYNDEVCVAFLGRAFRHGKAVAVVLNKWESDEAERDFRAKVLPQAAERAAGDIAVVVVPRLAEAARGPRGEGAWRARLRAVVAAFEAEAEGIRERARAGARRALREEAASLIEGARLEAEAIAHLRNETDEIARAAAQAYRAGVREAAIHEYDRVMRLLAEALRVPVFDDVYDRVRSAGSTILGRLGRLVGIADPETRLRRDVEERDRRDLESARVRLGEALAAVRRLPDRYPPEIAPALRAGLAPQDRADRLYELDEVYLEGLRKAAEAWTDSVARELHETLRGSPNLVRMAKGLKAALRIGATAGAVALTGPGGHMFGAHDLLVAPAVDFLMKFLIEAGVGEAFFAAKRDEFYEARAGVFAALVAERARAMLLANLRGGATPEAVAALEGALAAVAADADRPRAGAAAPASRAAAGGTP